MSAADCPLCGGNNQCAIAQGQPAAECWCQRVVIPAEVLTRVPESLRGEVCVCAGCLADPFALSLSKGDGL